MAPPRWTNTEQLTWLQNEVPMYLQMQKEKKLVRFFELLYPKWFSQFPEHMRIWPMGLSENLPDEDVDIGESGLGSDAAIDEVIAKLGDENTIIPVSDLEKLTDLDAELTEVLNDATQHRRKVRLLTIS